MSDFGATPSPRRVAANGRLPHKSDDAEVKAFGKSSGASHINGL
jgi:hypothetical protein